MATVYSLALQNFDTLSGGVFNAGHESLNVTKRQVLEAVKEIIPDYEIIDMSIGSDPDQRDYEVDYSSFREVTGFEPKYSLLESLKGVETAARLLVATSHSEWRV